VAERMLKECGEFFPYGGFMAPDGTITHVSPTTGEERPRGEDLVNIMTRDFRERSAGGHLRVAAMVSNVTVRHPGRREKVDAVEVRIDHVSGYRVHVFFPYQLGLGTGTLLDKPFATEGTAFAFGAA